MRLIPVFVICTVLLTGNSVLNAQGDAPEKVDFNFMDFKTDLGKLKGYKFVKHGQKFRIVISNLNKSLWGISDSTKQQSYNTDMPDVFKGIKLPGFLNLMLPAAQADTLLASQRESSTSLEEINNLFKSINAGKQVLTGAIGLNNDFKNLYANCDETYSVIESKLFAKVNEFLPGDAGERKSQPDALRRYLKGTVFNSIEALDKLKKIIPMYFYLLNLNIQSNTVNTIWNWKNTPPPKAPIEIYRTAGRAAQRAELENELIKAHMEFIKATLTNAEATVVEMQKFLDDDKINELINNYNLINESNWTYYSDEMKVKEDEFNVKVIISALKPLACNVQSKFIIDADYHTYGGVKIDFSTGLFLMTGSEDFLGRDLYYKPIDSSNTMIKSKDGGKRLQLGIGGLMHIYWRSKSKVKWAISPGLSTTTSFDGVNFHLGGSLITGGKNRIVFTLGVVLKESKILDRQYVVDKSYPKAQLPEAPPTIKVFPKFGGFFSLTYNWNKLKKQ
ncbi:MAG: hypothetical protein ABIQ88_09410 [Chitinophagaceae bacterium]